MNYNNSITGMKRVVHRDCCVIVNEQRYYNPSLLRFIGSTVFVRVNPDKSVKMITKHERVIVNVS